MGYSTVNVQLVIAICYLNKVYTKTVNLVSMLWLGRHPGRFVLRRQLVEYDNDEVLTADIMMQGVRNR